MADHWLNISGTNLDSACYLDDGALADALDGTDKWQHGVDETHWFILDLGETYTIKKVRGRSKETWDPTDVNIYVSDDKENWGSAVASGISTFQDTEVWAEEDTTDKSGRYIKVEIVETEIGGYVRWGELKIFDAYGDVSPEPSPVNTMLFGCNF